ncbi:MAG: hypothetical protein IPG68_01025 [Micrococcales bacterium]|nr:hypothetical protein [Micrococcales bacterium]
MSQPRARILMLDLDSWDGLVEWGSALRTHGLPVIRVVRAHRRAAPVRRWLDRWQFGQAPIEVTGSLVDDADVLAALTAPTVDVQGPETTLRELDVHLPAGTPAKELLRRVPEEVGQQTLYDKWRMTELALAEGLRVPASWEQQRDDVLPVVVKGRISAGGQDVEVVHSREELQRSAARMGQRDNGGVFFQEVFTGPVLNAAGVAKNGRLLVHAIYEATPEPDDPFGPPVLLRILDRPDVASELAALIAALGYTGVFCIDYVQDEHGRIGMVDFNPRVFGGWLQLQTAGVDFIAAYLHCLGLGPPPAFRPLATGTVLDVRVLAGPADSPRAAALEARRSLGAIRAAARVTGWRFGALKTGRTIGRALVDAGRSLRG